MTAQVFLDTESVGHPDDLRLLSIGLVSGDRDLYLELTQDEFELIPTRMLTLFASRFVEAQFGQVPGSAAPMPTMGARLAGWIAGLGSNVVEVIHVHTIHYRFFQGLLRRQSVAQLPILHPSHVGCIMEIEEGGQAAVEAYWDIDEIRGLRRHHALADAYALQARYLAVLRRAQ